MDPTDTPTPAVVRRTTIGTTSAEPAPAKEAPSLREYTDRPKGRLYTFKIPESVRDKERDPATFVLRELTPEDSLAAARIASQKGSEPAVVRLSLAYEQAKFSLFAVDGRQVDHAQFEGDMLFNRWSPKVQALMMAAYSKINSTTDQEDADFLSSMVVS